MLSGLPSDVDARPHPKLGKDVGHVRPDRTRRKHELLSDLPVGHTFGDHPGNLGLGGRETVPPGLRLPMLDPRPTPDPVLAKLSPQMSKIPVGTKPIVELIGPREGRPRGVPFPPRGKPDSGGLERLGPKQRPPRVPIPIGSML